MRLHLFKKANPRFKPFFLYVALTLVNLFSHASHAQHATILRNPQYLKMAKDWLETGYTSKQLYRDFIANGKCRSKAKDSLACIKSFAEGLQVINTSWSIQLSTDDVAKTDKVLVRTPHLVLIESAIEPSEDNTKKIHQKTKQEESEELLNRKKQLGQVVLLPSEIDKIWIFLQNYLKNNALLDALFTYYFLDGYYSAYDPFASVMTKKNLENTYENTEEVSYSDGYAYVDKGDKWHVVSVKLDSPAFWAGLQQLDDIIALNGIPIQNFYTQQGYEHNEIISLTVLRRGHKIDLEIHKIEQKRSHLESSILEWRGLKFLRFKLDTFSTSEENCKILSETMGKAFQKHTLSGIILDLRDNGGGFISVSNCILGLFLKPNMLASTLVSVSNPTQRSTSKVSRPTYDNGLEFFADYETPMTVLINESSASASEYTAGALRDNNRARLVGLRSYGKGTTLRSQNFPYNKNIVVYKTSAVFFQPNGTSNESVGIIPDFTVPFRLNNPTDETDAVRNEDKNPELKFKTNEAPLPYRQNEIADIEKCVDYKHLKDVYNRMEGSRVSADYQMLYALEVLRCSQ